MTDADKHEFAALMATLGAALPTRVIDAAVVRVYWGALRDLSLAELQSAVERAIARERFFPAVATLRDYARPVTPVTALAVRTFDEVERLGVFNGTTGETIVTERRVREALGDAAAEAFVAAGGTSAWVSLSQGQNRTFTRQRFVEAFLETQAADVSAPLLPATTQARLADPRVKQLASGVGQSLRRVK